MANQKVIDWFLEKKKSGEQITPEIIEHLANALEKRRVGRPNYQITHLFYLALNHICTVEAMMDCLEDENDNGKVRDVSSVGKLIQKARRDGWSIFYSESSMPKAKTKKDLKLLISKQKNKNIQVWIDSKEKIISFTFKFNSDEKIVSILHIQSIS
jgi:hypothetical protein